MIEPNKKHLYQCRSILRNLKEHLIDRLVELKKHTDKDSAIGPIRYYADQISSIASALEVLEGFRLDDWARHIMSPEERQLLRNGGHKVEFDIDFDSKPSVKPTELEPT